jgi:hypothetical protein
MKTRSFDGARRNAIRVMAGGASAGLLAQASRVMAQEKMSLTQAQYQGSPNGIYSCGNCSLFERPKSCKVVDGEVNEDGWCRVYSPVD